MGGLSDGESCTFIYDPCLSDIYGLDNNVYIFELESPGGNYTYTFDVEVRSISFIDTSATRLTPGGVMSYSADKEISENTWHFYQFTVTENDGYSTLDFAISTSCIQSGDALEIYASFVYTDGTDTHLEIVTPKRFPTADCNAQSSTASTTFSEFFDTCKMVAGTYQIGIYAPEDIDLVDETTFPTVTRSVQYTISAALETADYVLAVPGCPLTLTGDFTRRIELRMDAVPALSRVIFGLTDNDDDDSISDFTLRYGLTAPEGTADECTLDDSIIIPDSGSNSVVISACDLEVETIYFYVVGDFDDSDDSITFFSEIEYNYPVQLPSGADFVHSAVLPSRSTFVQADVPASELTTALTRYTQYYRYELASATTVSFTNAACSSCSFDVEIIDPDFNCDFNCPTTACASGVCNVSPCDYSSDYIYFAVTRNDAIPTDAATDANCTITVESVALFSSLTNARTLVDEVTQCEPVACEQLYQISGSDATRRISTETVTIDTDVDLTIYIGDDLSCPTVDSCTAGNTCTYTISTNCVLVDYIYVVVDDCSTCALRDALYSIVYNIDSSSATTLSTGSSLSATASLVEVSIPANSFGIYSTPSGASVSFMRMMRILALLLATLSLLLPILPLLLLSSSPILLLVSKLTLSLLPLSVVLAPLLSMKLDSNTLLTPFLPVFAELLSTSIMSKLPPKLFLLFVTWSTLVVPLLLLLLLLAEPCALLSTLSLLVPAPTMVPSLKMCVKVTLSTSPLVCALMSFVV